MLLKSISLMVNIMSKKHVQPLTAKQAWELMSDNPRSLMIDVRANMEYLFVGHPKGAINVSWIDEPDWEVNPNFVKEVRKLILGGVDSTQDKSSVPIILICRSGNRSLVAGELLLKEGLAEIYNVTDGFEGALDDGHHRSSLAGWRFEGLPWEQC